MKNDIQIENYNGYVVVYRDYDILFVGEVKHFSMEYVLHNQDVSIKISYTLKNDDGCEVMHEKYFK